MVPGPWSEFTEAGVLGIYLLAQCSTEGSAMTVSCLVLPWVSKATKCSLASK